MSNPLCPKCQRPVDSHAPHDLCPACLLQAMLPGNGEESVTERSGGPLQDHITAPERGQAGDRIGRYKLLQQIGEGGFGTVWMAEQVEPVTRRVALKIIKLGMDTREVIARFEAERQALAMMDHPNIAKVLDAGATDLGRPFFVMELVKGIPITQFCDQKQLGTRERLALFGDVCAAINHAHQKGIIHRDIKPSNVMVTLNGDQAVVKVIDFGIAKATLGKLTDKTLFTRLEQFIGTPVYMSPEQATASGLDIDTRSDIYALGILLYELLTGKPPFDAKSLASAGYEEMRRIIREVEPAKPSSRLSTLLGDERTILARARQIDPGKLNRMVEPDLDWIVMKAIEKDRVRRYETANGLAADIKRFLADEPVSATPPSAGYKFRKFARRNKTALRLTGGVAALLVAATVISTWQAIRATRAEEFAGDRVIEVAAERDAKDRAREEAETARQAEEAARKDAEAIANFLTGVFRSPDSARNGRTITVAEILDTAAKKLETDLSAQPARRVQMQSTLASSYRALGLNSEAIPLLVKTRNYYQATVGPEHPRTLEAILALASSYYQAGRSDDAFKLEESVMAIRIRVNGPEHPETLSSITGLAESSYYFGRRSGALKLQEQVVALRRKLFGPAHSGTLAAIQRLASFYGENGRGEEAIMLSNLVIKPLEERLALSRRMNGPDHPDTLRAIRNLVSPNYDTGRREQGMAFMTELLRLSRNRYGREHPDTLQALTDLAYFNWQAGKREEAILLQAELLALRRKIDGPEHPNTLYAMEWNATYYSDGGQPEAALKLREELLRIRRKVFGPEHPGTQDVIRQVAAAYVAAGRKEEASQLFEELQELHAKAKAPEIPDAPNATISQARSLMEAGLYAEAEPLLAALVDQATAAGSSGAAELESHLGQLAEVHFRLGHYRSAELLYRGRIQRNRDRGDEEGNADVIRATPSLARLLTAWAWAERNTEAAAAHSHAQEAESLLRESLQASQLQDQGTWRLADVQSRLGGAVFVAAIADTALTTAGRATKLAEAEALLKEGQQGMQSCQKSEAKYQRDGIERLIRLYEAWEKPDQAAGWKLKLEASNQDEIAKNLPIGAIASNSPLRSRFPARALDSGPELIDLSVSYNAFCDSEWQGRQDKGNDLGELPSGRQVLAGVVWDIRGIIQLSSRRLTAPSPAYPEKVEGIPVAQRCRRLHFLHAAAYAAGQADETIGHYVFHYADGMEGKLPIVTGRDVMDWWARPAEGAATPVVAWSGQNLYSRVLERSVQLFITTWENPRPGVEITALDFVSEMNDGAPFLIAVTAEP